MTNTRDRIFQVAVRLFSERGYNGVSIRDIVHEVGIKESSLYNHFRNKDAIMAAILDEFASQMLSREVTPETVAAALDAMPADQFFSAAFATYVDVMTNPFAVMVWRILVSEQFRDPRANRLINEEIGAKINGNARLALTMMKERALIRDVDIEAATLALNDAIKGMLFRFIGLGPDVKDEFVASANRHIVFIWDCIRKEP